MFPVFSQGSGLGSRLSGIRINLLLGTLTSSLVPKFDIAVPLSTEQAVPDDEEGLREVGLDAPALVVNVVIRSIVRREMLQWIPRERIATVVVDGLDGRKCEKPHGLTIRHSRNKESDPGACGIQQETFDRVVVQGSKRVGNVETVVTRVEGY